MKKRDLSAVRVGDAVAGTKALRKPTYILPVARGRYAGSQMFVYEWDKPGDEINNRMYSYVVVRDGRVAKIFEDPPDKYEKDALAAAYAHMDSEGERKLHSGNAVTGALSSLAEGLAIGGAFIPVVGPAVSMAGQAAGLTTQAVAAGRRPPDGAFNPMPVRREYLTIVPPENSPARAATASSENTHTSNP